MGTFGLNILIKGEEDKTMTWKTPNRNYDMIQFESLRMEIEEPYNDFHDQLSAAYYNGTVFSHAWLREWGYPEEIDFATLKQNNRNDAKRLFDELHGLQDMERQKKFHEENIRKPEEERIPEEKYNLEYDDQGNVIGNKYEKIVSSISKMRTEKGVK